MGMPLRAGFRWPDLAIALFCVFVLMGITFLALSRNRHSSRANGEVPLQLRSIHQAMLVYGLDNGNYLPGLNADGSLYTNQPAQRYGLLVEGNYLDAQKLLSPLDTQASVDYSYAILDIGSPGLRREAWTVEPRPHAVLLAERPRRKPMLGEWAGWVMYHRATLGPLSTPAEYAESPWVSASYGSTGASSSTDDLFSAESNDDAYLISDESHASNE